MEREILKVGDIKISLLAKEYYCRHCTEYTYMCPKRKHRFGIWFLLKTTVKDSDKARYFILGEGEREERFPFNVTPGKLKYTGEYDTEYWEYGHVTCGGWYSIVSVFELDEENLNRALSSANEKGELNADEKILLIKLINNNRQRIVENLVAEGVLKLEQDWAHWEDLKPLIKVFIRGRIIHLPRGAMITEKPNSYKADFTWGSIKIPFSKTSQYKSEFSSPIFYSGSPTIIECRKGGEPYTIYYDEFMGRKIVYHYRFSYHDFKTELVNCEEEHAGHKHAPAIIVWDDFDRYANYLFYSRLGDILFIPVDDFINTENLQPATEEQFNKIKILKGSIENQNGKKLVKKGTALYHPEHGLLEIQNDAIAYQVPYYERGHD